MSLEIWLAYVAASAVVLVVPGPTILTVISYSIAHGRRATPAVVPGVALGDSTALTVSLLGLGAALAASATTFTTVVLGAIGLPEAVIVKLHVRRVFSAKLAQTRRSLLVMPCMDE